MPSITLSIIIGLIATPYIIYLARRGPSIFLDEGLYSQGNIIRSTNKYTECCVQCTPSLLLVCTAPKAFPFSLLSSKLFANILLFWFYQETEILCHVVAPKNITRSLCYTVYEVCKTQIYMREVNCGNICRSIVSVLAGTASIK